jgi:hypothetical protein
MEPDAPQFPVDLYSEAADRVGWGCAALLFIENTWVHRRVERIDILSAQLVRRTVSVDFTVPGSAADLLQLEDDGQSLVPIATLSKRPLRNFDLRDEGGTSLAVVGKDHNGLVAHAALLAHAQFALRDADPPSRRLVEAFEVVAKGHPMAAVDEIVGLMARAEEGDEESRLILAHDAAQVLVRDLANNYILLAVLDDVRGRRILKYSYEEQLTLAPSSTHERLGWFPISVAIDVPAAAGPASYHAEVVVPEEVRILEAVMLDAEHGFLAEDGESDRAALYAPEVPSEARPQLVFLVALERGGMPLLGAAVALLTSLQLVVGAVLIDFDALRGAAPAVSVLLAGSAFFAAVLARSGEHRLVQSLFAGPRILLAVVAVCAVAAGSVLTYGVSSDAARTVWEVAALAAAAATGMLIRTAAVARSVVSGGSVQATQSADQS